MILNALKVESLERKRMNKEYIGQLTGIRIFLTLMVVISNMALFRDVDPGFVKHSDWFSLNVFASAPVRVDIFFMLTGFLLFYVYRTEFSEKITYKNYTKFLLIRLARVYPVHLLTLCMILLLYSVNIWQSIDHESTERITEPGSWLLNITLLNAWGLSEGSSSWNGPAWSISAEFFNYLLFPIIALLIVNIKNFWLQITICIGVLVFYEYLQFVAIKDLNTYNGMTALLRSLVGMTLGMLLAQIYLSKRLENLPWDYIAVALIAGIAIMMIILMFHIYETKERPQIYILFYLPLPLLVMSIASSRKFIKKFFSLPILIYFGNLSFCIYMLHQPISRMFHFFLADYYTTIALEQNSFVIMTNLIVVLATMIGISAVVYKYIEVPARTWLKKKIVQPSKA